MIKVEGLEFHYVRYSPDDNEEKSVALSGIDLEINKGEFVAILGHNGSGKSTLAKHFNALLLPTGGTVWVKSMSTADESHLWDIRSSVGMVFQNPDNQIIASIVEEDIAFGPENLSVPSPEIRVRVDEALDAVSMSGYKKRSPHNLSGGQKQRIAIAGILAMRPECIVFDEPTAMLDPVGRREVMDAILRLNKDYNITVVLITHFMEEAVKSDRVVVMSDGSVIMSGTPREIFCFDNITQLKSVGLDVPQMTELAHMLKQSGLDIGNGILTVDEMLDALNRYKNSL